MEIMTKFSRSGESISETNDDDKETFREKHKKIRKYLQINSRN